MSKSTLSSIRVSRSSIVSIRYSSIVYFLTEYGSIVAIVPCSELSSCSLVIIASQYQKGFSVHHTPIQVRGQ
jgi:hypothetical protein